MKEFLTTIALDYAVIFFAVVLTQIIKKHILGKVKDRIVKILPFLPLLMVILYVSLFGNAGSFTNGVRITLNMWLISLGLYSFYSVIFHKK